MCGIVGICSSDGTIRESAIASAGRAIAHRGPDDEGYLIFRQADGSVHEYGGDDSLRRDLPEVDGVARPIQGIALGHRRLSIIDPSVAGHQPMSSQDRRYWLVYNGEIYNYIELRRELADRGHRFVSGSDTEVLLAAFAAWGDRCVERFNGMFAFAVLDTIERRLFCARDRFGVKPFYYHSTPRLFAFASEPKALLTVPGVPKRAAPGRVYDFLAWGLHKSGAETFFDGIYELPAGATLSLHLPSMLVSTSEYYRYVTNPAFGRYSEREFERLAGEVRERIFSAVRIRLRSDVAVGSCLSGGIDSSSIVGLVGRMMRESRIDQLGDHQRVFTACFPATSIDETPYAQEVVTAVGCTWHQVEPVAADFWRDMGHLAFSQDEPFGGPSIYTQYRVMRMAREAGVKVLLDGQGGDEVFAGYESCYPAFFLDMARHGRLGRLITEWTSLGNAPVSRAYTMTRAAAYLGVRFLPAPLQSWFGRAYRGSGGLISGAFEVAHRERNDRIRERGAVSLNGLLGSMVRDYTLPLLLRWEDRNSMAWGIEARTPFADDHPLMEHVAQIPGGYKIRRGWSKVLLRRAMSDVLPPGIAARRTKLGFDTPTVAWLAAGGDTLRDLLSDEQGIVNGAAVVAAIPAILGHGSAHAVNAAWRIVSYAAWKRAFRVADPL